MERNLSMRTPVVKELGIRISVEGGNKLVRKTGPGVMGFGLSHLTAKSARRNIYSSINKHWI